MSADIIRTSKEWLAYVKKELGYTAVISLEFKGHILEWVTYAMQLVREETKKECGTESFVPPEKLLEVLLEQQRQLADFIEHTFIDCCHEGSGMFHVDDCPAPEIQRKLADKVRRLGDQVAKTLVRKFGEKHAAYCWPEGPDQAGRCVCGAKENK